MDSKTWDLNSQSVWVCALSKSFVGFNVRPHLGCGESEWVVELVVCLSVHHEILSSYDCSVKWLERHAVLNETI